jgi:hypothetical protein
MNYFITVKTPSYALDDTLNYNYVLSHTIVECFSTYVDIINAYMTQAKSMHTPNNILYTYLLEKGLSTINHIFKLMLLYTKNLALTNYYCRQTIGYYVEFIVQNMQHEVNDIINYNNASRFSYSKTIDKLIKHYRKTSYNELDDNSAELLSIIEAKETDLYSEISMLLEVYNKLLMMGTNNLAQHLLTLVTNEAYPREKLAVLLAFINNFPLKNETALNYIYCLCAHLTHDLPTTAAIIKKLVSAENKIRLQTDSVDTYICWIMM